MAHRARFLLSLRTGAAAAQARALLEERAASHPEEAAARHAVLAELFASKASYLLGLSGSQARALAEAHLARAAGAHGGEHPLARRVAVRIALFQDRDSARAAVWFAYVADDAEVLRPAFARARAWSARPNPLVLAFALARLGEQRASREAWLEHLRRAAVDVRALEGLLATADDAHFHAAVLEARREAGQDGLCLDEALVHRAREDWPALARSLSDCRARGHGLALWLKQMPAFRKPAS